MVYSLGGTPQIVIIWYLNGIPPIKQPRGLFIQGWHYVGFSIAMFDDQGESLQLWCHPFTSKMTRSKRDGQLNRSRSDSQTKRHGSETTIQNYHLYGVYICIYGIYMVYIYIWYICL